MARPQAIGLSNPYTGQCGIADFDQRRRSAPMSGPARAVTFIGSAATSQRTRGRRSPKTSNVRRTRALKQLLERNIEVVDQSPQVRQQVGAGDDADVQLSIQRHR